MHAKKPGSGEDRLPNPKNYAYSSSARGLTFESRENIPYNWSKQEQHWRRNRTGSILVDDWRRQQLTMTLWKSTIGVFSAFQILPCPALKSNQGPPKAWND